MMVSFGVVLFWCGLFGALEASCICMGISLSRFGNLLLLFCW
jgi:hypothetical protein